VTPDAGYHAVMSGTCGGTLTENTYTTNSITSDCTVIASFAINTYTVTASVVNPAGGSVSPASQDVSHGSPATFTVTTNPGYTASVSEGSLAGNTWTIPNVTSPHTVTVTFTINTYTVTPSAGTGGSISPSTSQTVSYGGTTQFTVTPDTGYHIDSVIGCGGTLTVNTYTTGSITANCTVTATFTPISTTYNFEGFFSPVDNDVVNKANAGQAIPVKWRITDANGIGVSDPTSFNLTSYLIRCTDLSGSPEDTIEQYTSASGLQYLGDGYWQYNWKTPKTYKNTCRKMILNLKDGTQHDADFKFK